MRIFAAITAVFFGMTSAAIADGFAVQNFERIKLNLSTFKGGTYESMQERGRIIIACETCDDMVSLVVEKGRSTDGTEERFRSGETTIGRMEEICKRNAPDCKLTRTDVGHAVGWTTQYKTGSIVGSTTVLFAQGDLLTIRAIGPSRRVVDRNMRTAVQTIAPRIVGK